MLVKAQTFRSDGRYPTASARAAYLEKGGRSVERGTLNVVDEGKPWAELDKTSAQYHLRGAVVGREYVLSPSPEDMATPSQMREFALEWANRCFPNAEVVVVVHEDGKERLSRGDEPIAHAHVYVNAPDLETGRKITVSNARAREVHDVAQDMCEKRGWSQQERYYDRKAERVRHVESHRSEYERRPQWQRLDERRNPHYEASGAKGRVSRYEFERHVTGAELDKTRIRRSLKEAAREVARNPQATLSDELRKRGVAVEHAVNGDMKYRLETGSREFRGATLGREFERSALERSIQRSRETLPKLDVEKGIELGQPPESARGFGVEMVARSRHLLVVQQGAQPR